jgi:hypothetical protein
MEVEEGPMDTEEDADDLADDMKRFLDSAGEFIEVAEIRIKITHVRRRGPLSCPLLVVRLSSQPVFSFSSTTCCFSS